MQAPATQGESSEAPRVRLRPAAGAKGRLLVAGLWRWHGMALERTLGQQKAMER